MLNLWALFKRSNQLKLKFLRTIFTMSLIPYIHLRGISMQSLYHTIDSLAVHTDHSDTIYHFAHRQTLWSIVRI